MSMRYRSTEKTYLEVVGINLLQKIDVLGRVKALHHRVIALARTLNTTVGIGGEAVSIGSQNEDKRRT